MEVLRGVLIDIYVCRDIAGKTSFLGYSHSSFRVYELLFSDSHELFRRKDLGAVPNEVTFVFW